VRRPSQDSFRPATEETRPDGPQQLGSGRTSAALLCAGLVLRSTAVAAAFSLAIHLRQTRSLELASEAPDRSLARDLACIEQ
jgi:hypothetical protein